MRPIQIDLDPADVDPNGIAEAQQLVGAGNLALDGALVSGGVATLDYARQLNITSAGNLSAVTFTITGTDADGKAQTEAVTGPNATTVESTKYFKTVTQVAASGAVGSDVEVGTVDEIISRTIPIDRVSDSQATIAVNVTGTVDFTVEETFENFQNPPLNPQQDCDWFSISALAAKTADTVGAASVGASAVRIKFNSYSSGAEAQVHIAQPTGR